MRNILLTFKIIRISLYKIKEAYIEAMKEGKIDEDEAN